MSFSQLSPFSVIQSIPETVPKRTRTNASLEQRYEQAIENGGGGKHTGDRREMNENNAGTYERLPFCFR
jgi:hypothetical protein